MTIAFITLGCKLNYAETSTYERGFKAAGLTVVPWRQKADIYLINTCAVTQTSTAKSRNEIRKVHRINPDARIIVTGCYAQLEPEEIKGIQGVSLVFGSGSKGRLVAETLRYVGIAVPEGMESPGGDVLAAFSTGERTRSFLKVQDGCNSFCAYCTVPYARGESRNIPIEECVRNARLIAAEGAREIVLTGVNTGDFGRTTGESFLDLLKALEKVEGIERYRISSIEPNLLTRETVDWIASGTKFQPHFHIPLQTGDDELLEKVGRKYTTEQFAGLIDYIRLKMGPKVFFGIDVIVGLPGETPERFERTYAFLAERIRPAFIHIFPYSRRPGTRADSMPEQVRDSVKTERVKRLEELCETLSAGFRASCKGMKEKVLWESDNHGGMMSGYTGNYLRMEREWDSGRIGTIEEITI